jgi:DNA replication protein DnaC
MTTYDPYDDEANLAQAQELVRRERLEHRLRVLLDQRPPAFADEGELHPDIQAWITRYLRNQAGTLVLVGTIGTGKTWSLWKTIETLVRRGWAGSFEIAAAYEVKEATDRPINEAKIRIWREADLFAIDDVGSQRLNDWDADALLALIDRRWQYKRPLIITSNVLELKDLLGERVASRLVDGATLVTFAGDDRRRNR